MGSWRRSIPDTRAIHLQIHDDLLLAVNGPSMWTMQVDAQAYYSGSPAGLLKGRQYTAGVRVYDIAHPEAPREIAFMATEGVGPSVPSRRDGEPGWA